MIRTLAAYAVLAKLYWPVTAILACWALGAGLVGLAVGWLIWGPR